MPNDSDTPEFLKTGRNPGAPSTPNPPIPEWSKPRPNPPLTMPSDPVNERPGAGEDE